MRTYKVFHITAEWSIDIDDTDMASEDATRFARHMVMHPKKEFLSDTGVPMLIRHCPVEKKPAPLDHILVTWDQDE